MLSEHFVISTLGLSKSSVSELKDSSVQIYDQKSTSVPVKTFKKSSTAANALAISPSHVYAAQAQKATIHVYSREKGNQETLITFPERFRCIHFAGDAQDGGVGILIIGSELGNLIIWEVATGRQIFSPRSHLQSITCIAVDPSYTHILTGSDDSNIQVWSIQALISFSPVRDNEPSPGPIRTLSRHRASISSLVVGHSSSNTNIAISASQDKTCIIWNYHEGSILRTILISSTPLCLALDPADRALFIGLDDGSIQMVDFFGLGIGGTSAIGKSRSDLPFQAQDSDRWTSPSQELGSTHSIAVLYEGTYLLSCHDSGKVVRWNITTGSRTAYDVTILTLEHPVTNIKSLAPLGFPSPEPLRLKLSTVLKPRFDPSISQSQNGSMIPPGYSITAQLPSFAPQIHPSPSNMTASNRKFFSLACSHPSFPESLLQYDPETTGAVKDTERIAALEINGNNGGSDPYEDDLLQRLEAAVTEAQAAAQSSKERYDALLLESKELFKREEQRKRAKQQERTRLAAEGKELPSKLNGGKPLKKGERLVRYAGRPRVLKTKESEIFYDEISSTDDGGPDSTDESISSGQWVSQEHD